MQYRVFNTGDQIWVSQRYGKEVTVKILTHDGVVWNEGDAPNSIIKLTGLKAALHKVEVVCIKFILKIIT